MTWTYRVTNTGTFDPVDVLVVDLDGSGEEVLRTSIPLLAAGETRELTATGTAVVGQ